MLNNHNGKLNSNKEWEFDLNKNFNNNVLDKSHIKINDSFSSIII